MKWEHVLQAQLCLLSEHRSKHGKLHTADRQGSTRKRTKTTEHAPSSRVTNVCRYISHTPRLSFQDLGGKIIMCYIFCALDLRIPAVYNYDHRMINHAEHSPNENIDPTKRELELTRVTHNLLMCSCKGDPDPELTKNDIFQELHILPLMN